MKTPIEDAFRKHLLALGRTYAKANGLTLSTVGGKCAGDGYFFDRLADKKPINVRTYEKVVDYFRKKWPKDAARFPWPSVPRIDLPHPK